jgi:hypothetical protein
MHLPVFNSKHYAHYPPPELFAATRLQTHQFAGISAILAVSLERFILLHPLLLGTCWRIVIIRWDVVPCGLNRKHKLHGGKNRKWHTST